MTFLIANVNRPVSGPIYNDEYIERWAEVYLAHPELRLLGVPFSAFLAFPNPTAWNNVAHRVRWSQHLRRAEAAIAAAERAEGHGENGRLVEKIKHHKHPRSSRDFMPLRDA